MKLIKNWMGALEYFLGYVYVWVPTQFQFQRPDGVRLSKIRFWGRYVFCDWNDAEQRNVMYKYEYIPEWALTVLHIIS